MIATERPNQNIPKVFELISKLEVEVICQFLRNANEKYSQEFDKFVEYFRSIEREDGCEVNIESPTDFIVVKEISEQLAFVALYRVIELHSKQILKMRYKNEKRKKVDNYKIKKIAEMLSKEGINLFDFNYYCVADEIRLLNNAIKHESQVSSELAKKYPNWGDKGDKLRNLEAAFNRLAPDVPKYLRAFVERVIP